MSESTAREIVRTVRQFGRAKADPFEMLMVEGLQSRGILEERARAAARECSNRIWRNGMVTGAAAVVLVSATSANLPGAVAGGSAAALGGLYTFLLSNACREVRELSGFEVLTAVNQLLAGR
jgi:hypothetical protein